MENKVFSFWLVCWPWSDGSNSSPDLTKSIVVSFAKNYSIRSFIRYSAHNTHRQKHPSVFTSSHRTLHLLQHNTILAVMLFNVLPQMPLPDADHDLNSADGRAKKSYRKRWKSPAIAPQVKLNINNVPRPSLLEFPAGGSGEAVQKHPKRKQTWATNLFTETERVELRETARACSPESN